MIEGGRSLTMTGAANGVIDFPTILQCPAKQWPWADDAAGQKPSHFWQCWRESDRHRGLTPILTGAWRAAQKPAKQFTASD